MNVAARRRASPWPALLVAGLLAAPPVMAQTQPQFKEVGPDGRITYTDRPSTDPGVRVVPLGRELPLPEATPLPLALRQLVARFPVTLYVSAECTPCDGARRLLQRRGIPYAERLVASDEDLAALQQLTAARTVPALTIGAQALRGYLEAEWNSYLDAAGYPRESKLPRDYQPPAATPLAPRPASVAAEAPLPAVSAEPLPRIVPATPPSGIRF